MIRLACVLSLLLLSGCGEAERPHFVPATGETPAAAARPADRTSREVVVPKNIPMH